MRVAFVLLITCDPLPALRTQIDARPPVTSNPTPILLHLSPPPLALSLPSSSPLAPFSLPLPFALPLALLGLNLLKCDALFFGSDRRTSLRPSRIWPS